MKKYLLIFTLASIPLFGYLFWHFSTPDTLTTNLSPYQKAGDEVKNSLSSLPALPIQEEDERYTIEDTTKEGIQITYQNQTNKDDSTTLATEPTPETKPSLTLHFPKKYASEPIEVQIAEGKSILIQDKTAKGDYTSESLSLGSSSAGLAGSTSKLESDKAKVSNNPISWIQSLLGGLSAELAGSTSKLEEERAYLSYTDATKRITTYYAYGHDQATGEKQLKNWQVYNHPAIVKGESVAYSFTNAKLRKNENGTISVYYYGDQELQNDKASAQVDPSLMARAQRTLAKEMGDSIDSGETPANFVIPKPYYINATGDQVTLDWRLSMDGKDISIDFTPDTTEYPLALDPTLSFTAPGQSNTGDVITGEAGSNLGSAVISGDFNADGKTDLAVSATGYSTNTGRAYIFYGDGTLSSSASGADVVITGETTNNYFGSLAAGDFNSDGKQDLAVGASGYSTNTGRAYLFYNDGNYPAAAGSADSIITGEASNSNFAALGVGDVNADGKDDLVVGAWQYSGCLGRVYLFYNDGNYPAAAGSADSIITGEAGNYCLSGPFAFIDVNSDGKEDLIVGNSSYSSNAGRVLVFYNDGAYPALASSYDLTLGSGGASQRFGVSLATGDFNLDGREDLAVGAYAYSTDTGRVYIFYNDGSMAIDVTITGEATNNYFGRAGLAAGDFNSDGRIDLAVGAYGYSTNTGRAYIFYNDGSIPTTAGTADVILTGEASSSQLGYSLTSGDFNADGKIDFAVGATGYSSSIGRAYIFYSQNGQVNTNQNITGNASGDYFGSAMTTGDFNADGRIDLAVGAPNYSTNTGRAYIFYGDGQIPSTAGTADVTITGEATNNYFGQAMTAGDFNADGKTDLVVGAWGYSTNTGRAYIFYNDGSIPTTAATADYIITGVDGRFGSAFSIGDLDSSGTNDLVVSAWSTGKLHIFYNDGTIPTTAATADVTITSAVPGPLVTGDFNSDGRIDLAIGDTWQVSGDGTGRAYIFYNDGSIPTTSATADVTITGEATGNSFGYDLVAGDFNSDGKTDLAVGAPSYSTNTGRAYIFYNDGSIPTTAATADVTITGEGTENYFGDSLAAGDFNADGRTDLAVGARKYGFWVGRVYIFYNDGSIPMTATTADISLTGAGGGVALFGFVMVADDFNSDGKTDLVVSEYGYSTNTGRVYFYETRENFSWKLQSVSPLTGGLRTGLSGTGQELKITGNAASDQFGYAMTTGDFNSDGKIDLAVGGRGYSTNTGRVYLFYNNGSLSPSSISADVIITGGATNNYFGQSLASGDFNSDGRTDLVVGATGHASDTGRVYIFYNDGSIPITTVTSDVIITGQAGSSYFGNSMIAGDFNADGRTDLAVGANGYSSSTGRAYIFYNDGVSFGTVVCTTGCLASDADVIIAGGGTNNYFSYAFTSGDFNADGRVDIVVGAPGYSSSTGRAYIFYNDGASFGTVACTTDCLESNADVIIAGQTTSNYFGYTLTTGDFDSDGSGDIAVGAILYSSDTGRAYILYNDGSIPTTAATADVIISGEGGRFGLSLIAGDLNADGRTDLAVGAHQYSSSTGRAYIFYNDGSIPTTAATADVILTGEAASNYFGYAFAAGDLNSDGKTDLVVGAYGYSGSKGRAYIYTFNDPVITGETTNNSFGTSLISGDFNADGKTDLAVGAPGYSTNTGRVYLFYQDGSIPSLAASADVIITGEATSNYFGSALTAGDLNADGKTDLAVGAYGYSTNTGRAYIFYNGAITTENASGADIIITGATNYFGRVLTVGDLNSDGRVDLVVDAPLYSGYTGRVYIFYNDGVSFGTTICTTDCLAVNADVYITGQAGDDWFGYTLVVGDFNIDGRTDLAVGAWGYSAGRAYIFYSDGTNNFGTATCSGTPAACLGVNADIIISAGSTSYFAYAMTNGDFNSDGRIDLVIGAYGGNSAGSIYIFYSDGVSFGTTVCTSDCLATNADVTIVISGSDQWFGYALTSGDFNADGRTDLAVGSIQFSTVAPGKVYIFYNDGSIPTTAATADVILTGEANNNYFGGAMTAGDLNGDGKTDLAVGAYAYSTNTGRAYLFTSEAAVQTPTVDATTRGQVKFRGQVKLR